VPSPHAALLASGWLGTACLVILAAVALPLPARIGLCVVIATPALAAIRASLLLRGAGAVAGLRWTAEGWFASFGPERTERPVTICAGSFRLGGVVMVLWLRACDGIHAVCIHAGRQDAGSFRRLCRRLAWTPRQPSNEPEPAS